MWRDSGQKNNIYMFSLVYNHLKLRISAFSLPQNESFISTEGAGRDIMLRLDTALELEPRSFL